MEEKIAAEEADRKQKLADIAAHELAKKMSV
jgi:hypothetical protein